MPVPRRPGRRCWPEPHWQAAAAAEYAIIIELDCQLGKSLLKSDGLAASLAGREAGRARRRPPLRAQGPRQSGAGVWQLASGNFKLARRHGYTTCRSLEVGKVLPNLQMGGRRPPAAAASRAPRPDLQGTHYYALP
jgi:hypothetical protein